jgi:transposase
MKAYSLDLRERIVAAVAEGVSKAEAARRFSVDLSTVKRYVRRAAAGILAPRRSPGRPRRIGPEQEPALVAQVERRADADLAEHCRAWAAEQGAAVSRATMSRALARAGLARKNLGWQT